ncbi:hypothetical protein REPUB_Repub05bG0066000 [Reevesia pubescens]
MNFGLMGDGHGALNCDDKDVYFDDEYAEVVISSLRLGDDQGSSLFTNSNWFAFQDDGIDNTPVEDVLCGNIIAMVGLNQFITKNATWTNEKKVNTYSNVCPKLVVNDIKPCSKVSLSFKIPDHKSSKLKVQYLHPHIVIDSNIGMNLTPLLELSTTIKSKELSLGVKLNLVQLLLYLLNMLLGLA